jgi:Spy/CpxP family protein refolding chaperone
MNIMQLLLVLSGLVLLSNSVHADQTLESGLGLSMDQAKQVMEIQKKYRQPFAAKRQELNDESRKLRRAHLDKDSAMVAHQQVATEKLRDELRQIRNSENEQIRTVLTAEQNQKFDLVLEQRRAAHGSARDERILE